MYILIHTATVEVDCTLRWWHRLMTSQALRKPPWSNTLPHILSLNKLAVTQIRHAQKGWQTCQNVFYMSHYQLVQFILVRQTQFTPAMSAVSEKSLSAWGLLSVPGLQWHRWLTVETPGQRDHSHQTKPVGCLPEPPEIWPPAWWLSGYRRAGALRLWSLPLQRPASGRRGGTERYEDRRLQCVKCNAYLSTPLK